MNNDKNLHNGLCLALQDVYDNLNDPSKINTIEKATVTIKRTRSILLAILHIISSPKIIVSQRKNKL